MDEYLIYEFTDETSALTCLAAINTMAANYWAEQGYTVVDGENGKELIGKCNGVDAPDAARTITWDTVKQSPDGTFYFSSLSNEERLAAGTQQLGAAGFSFVERELPEEWRETVSSA